MSMSAIIERTLFKDKDGGGVGATHYTIIKHRFLSFLIWQSLHSSLLLFLSKALFLSPFTQTPFTPNFFSLFSFLLFHFYLLLFSVSLFSLSSPRPLPSASPLDLLFGLARLLFISGGSSDRHRVSESEFRRRTRVSLSFVLFVSLCAVAGAVSVLCVCWSCDVYYVESRSRSSGVYGKLGFRGFVVGLFYGLHYVYQQRWLLRFPIIQRPPFFSFKMGLPSAFGQALKFSAAGYLLSGVLAFFLLNEYTSQATMGTFIREQIIFYIGSFVVIVSWELSHHLHQVLHTKRFVFAPPKGSAAAETNPSEPLLATLEESTPNSLLQYLAYLDMCMVCESNVDTWRRAAFFEETGETYKRVIAVCLRPLEQIALQLIEGIDSSSVDNSFQLSRQLRTSAVQPVDSKLRESFYDAQLCAWCARIIASLTARSRKEDRYGIAQLSGSNAAVISTLLSSLLAVETLMGKKTNLQAPNYLMGPAGIKWATMSTGRRDSTGGATGKRRDSPLYAKAYAMADILKTSIYCIVSAFHDEMLNSSKAGHLEKDWFTSGKPLYGTHELLLQKLRLFLDYQAS